MAFTNVKRLKRTLKALVIGPTGAGKTYPGLQLEGPIAALDGEDGLRAYMDMFNFDLDPFDTIDELNGKLEGALADAEVMQKYTSFVVDGMTVAWQEALNAAENDNGQIEFSRQRELKDGFKEFNRLVMKLGKRGKNVWATAQSKADWVIVPGKKPELKGVKGDVDNRVWFAFDLVLFVDVKDGKRQASVLKSRFPRNFPVGTTLEDFNVKTTLAPIFDGTAQYVPETEEDGLAAEMARTRDQIKTKLGVLSAKNGGPLAIEKVKELWTKATSSTSIDEMAAILAELRVAESDATVGV